jgi:hypothetical protein
VSKAGVGRPTSYVFLHYAMVRRTRRFAPSGFEELTSMNFSLQEDGSSVFHFMDYSHRFSTSSQEN